MTTLKFISEFKKDNLLKEFQDNLEYFHYVSVPEGISVRN